MKNIGNNKNANNNGDEGDEGDENEEHHAIVTTTEEKGGVQIVKSLIRDVVSSSHGSSGESGINNNKLSEEEEKKRREQELVDASTGTVTTNSNTNLQNTNTNSIQNNNQHVSCNEIMAKAVVIASEEKDAAYIARDDALSKLHSAETQITTLSSQLEVALSTAQNATIEAEATKLMTQRYIEEYKDQKNVEMEELITSHAKLVKELNQNHSLAIIDLLSSHEDEVRKLTVQLQSTREDYEQRLKTQAENARDEIAKIKAVAKKDVDEMKTIVDLERSKLEHDTILLKQQMADEKLKLETNFTTYQQQLINATNLEKARLTKDYETKLQSKSNELSTLRNTLHHNEITFNETIANMTAQHGAHILSVQTDAKENEKHIMDGAYKIETNIKREMEDLRRDVNQLIKDNTKKAKAEYERITTSARNEVETIVKETAADLKEKDGIIAELQSASRVTKVEHEARETELQSSIDELNDKSNALEVTLEEKERDLQYWKNVGDHPTYVNVTLITNDVSDYVQDVRDRTMDVMEMTRRTVVENVVKSVQSTILPFQIKCRTIYDTQLKDTVDDTWEKGSVYIVPFYQQYIHPTEKKVVTAVKDVYNEQVLPVSTEVAQSVKDMAGDVKRETIKTLCMGTIHAANLILDASATTTTTTTTTKSDGSGSSSTSSSSTINRFLKKIVEDDEYEYEYTAQIVGTILKCTLFITLFIFRYTVLRCTFISIVWTIRTTWAIMTWMVLLPFRVVWFFCPLRFLFIGGGDKSGVDKKKKVKGGSSSSSSRKTANGSGTSKTYKNGASASIVKS